MIITHTTQKVMDEHLHYLGGDIEYIAKCARETSSWYYSTTDKVRDFFCFQTDTIRLTRHSQNKALRCIRTVLEKRRKEIIDANLKDLENAKGKISDQMFKRLGLGEKKFEQLLKGVSSVEALKDPVGRVTLKRELHNGLILSRETCPIGVLCVIFEARPEAAVQIACLAVKSGNAVILKGGSEAYHSNRALVSAMREGLKEADMIEDMIQLVSSREDVHNLLKWSEYIDLVIPRGSGELVRKIQQSTSIPVMGHADGICSVYVDKDANIETAVRVVVDSKTNYPAACNAAETLLVHRDVLESALIPIGKALMSRGVTKIYADKDSIKYVVFFLRNT